MQSSHKVSCKNGIEVFSDASIRIYQYGEGFDLPFSYAQTIVGLQYRAVNCIEEHFSDKQIKLWKKAKTKELTTLVQRCQTTYLIFDDQEEIIGYALIP